MIKLRNSYLKVIEGIRKKRSVAKDDRRSKDEICTLEKRKEAVRTIEKYWSLILLRRELIKKK